MARPLQLRGPDRRLRDDERDEFAHWSSGTGDSGFANFDTIHQAPTKRADLILWLKHPPKLGVFDRDNRGETCAKHPINAGFALVDLAAAGHWPFTRWQTALYVWSEKRRPRRTWRCFASFLIKTPDDVLQSLDHAVSSWLEAVGKVIDHDESLLLGLCERLLSQAHQDDVSRADLVHEAINHPIGKVTGALLHLLLNRKPKDEDSLPTDIEPFFTRLCDTRTAQFQHGRVLLAANVIQLFCVDKAWTDERLLPLFDWGTSPHEAIAAWQGFLLKPRLYWPLISALKSAIGCVRSHTRSEFYPGCERPSFVGRSRAMRCVSSPRSSMISRRLYPRISVTA